MKKHEIMPSIIQRLAWVPLRAFLTVFCSLEIKGVENIKNLKGNMIISSNHTSELDPLLIVACLPFFSPHLPLFFVSRERSFYEKGWGAFMYGGTFFRMMGAYRAYVGLKNYKESLRHHIEVIQKGSNVCIFPVGKKHLSGEPAKARGGVSFLARETALPIMPVRIKGIEGLTFSDFLARKRKLTVVFGSPLSSSDIFDSQGRVRPYEEQNEYAEAARILMEKIAQLT